VFQPFCHSSTCAVCGAMPVSFPLLKLRGSALLAASCAFAVAGGFLFGYDTGVVSGAVLLLRSSGSNCNFLSDGAHSECAPSDSRPLLPSAGAAEAFVSVALASAMLGAAFGGTMGDSMGRRAAIALSSAFFTVGSLTLSLSNSFGLLIAGRVVVGLGIGVASAVVPVYVAEVTGPPPPSPTLLRTCGVV
jgi:MFS transporter, SP family, solute carrier family 2 (myo-inositol transporter), member 13